MEVCADVMEQLQHVKHVATGFVFSRASHALTCHMTLLAVLLLQMLQSLHAVARGSCLQCIQALLMVGAIVQ